MNPRDGDPRVPDGWFVEPRSAASVTRGYYPRRRRILPLLALVGMVATFVLGFLFHAAVTSAAPRSASEDRPLVWVGLSTQGQSEAPRIGEAPHGPARIGEQAPRSGDASPSAPVLTVPEDAEPTGDIGTALTSGWATYYDDGPGLYAAVPSWRWGDTPYRVTVCRWDDRSRCVRVQVRDACGCYVGTPDERLIDLSPTAFSRLAPLSRGKVRVVVYEGPAVTPPATDR